MIDKGEFNELGQTFFTDKHKYTLPPYLKAKYSFGSDNMFYKDSVKNWADLHKINNLEQAQKNRNLVVERSLIAAKIARGGIKLDLLKAEKNEMLARQSRFVGFQDYDTLDSQIGFDL